MTNVNDLLNITNVTDGVEHGTFAALAPSNTALLTTFRSGGEGVSSPVSLALRADRAYFVTAVDSRKAARLARCERVELTSCTVAGAPIGDTVRGRARPIANGRVPGLLRPTGPLLWSWLLYRLRGNRMRFYEVEPTEEGGAR